MMGAEKQLAIDIGGAVIIGVITWIAVRVKRYGSEWWRNHQRKVINEQLAIIQASSKMAEAELTDDGNGSTKGAVKRIQEQIAGMIESQTEVAKAQVRFVETIDRNERFHSEFRKEMREKFEKVTVDVAYIKGVVDGPKR